MKAGVTCVIVFMFLYSALSSGDASSVMPIMGSKVIFAGLRAVPMIGETHGWYVSCRRIGRNLYSHAKLFTI